jgi:purine-binding chemotaxis protein CheW
MANTSCMRRSSVGAPSHDPVFVRFELGGQAYGVDVAEVYGIYHGLPLIPLPDSPPFMDGEVQLADRRIPVVNLRRFAGMPEMNRGTEPRWILMVHNIHGPVGLTVDRVQEVIRLTKKNLGQPTAHAPSPVAEYVTAVADVAGHPMYLPDFSRLLCDATF